MNSSGLHSRLLFRISKIQFFESKSQLTSGLAFSTCCCSEYQRYNFLKANHNGFLLVSVFPWLFRISKIQFFESKSQLNSSAVYLKGRCSEYQRYNFLKANHNRLTKMV